MSVDHLAWTPVGYLSRMGNGLTDADLTRIEDRAKLARSVAAPPWEAFLETRAGIGGGSFMRLGSDSGEDIEMYLDLFYGNKKVGSPDPRLDAILDFIAHAGDDIVRLVAELRQVRAKRD